MTHDHSERSSPSTEEILTQLRTAVAHGHAATNWTAPLLRTELGKRSWGASECMLRRTLHWLGYRWTRPKFVLGRPAPAYAEKKAVAKQVAIMVAGGGRSGSAMSGARTTVREFPLLPGGVGQVRHATGGLDTPPAKAGRFSENAHGTPSR